jgi:hypothetical protein
MAASENLKRELEGIEGRIEGLQDTLWRVEDLRAAGIRPGWLQVLGIRMLKTDLRRRIRELEQRRRVVLNCYTEARKYEGWLGRAERDERREGAVL